MICAGRHRALQRQQPAHGDIRDRAGTLAAEDRLPVDLRDVDAVARRVLGDVAGLGEEAVPAADRCDGRLERIGGEELERGEHAPVDDAGEDVAPPARVDLDVRVGEDALGERVLAHEQDLADRAAGQRARAARAEDVRRLQQPPALDERLGIDPRRALAGRADREAHVRLRRPSSRRAGADAAEDRAGDDAPPGEQPLELELVALQADVAGEVRAQARFRGQRERRVEDLTAPAGGQRARPRRVGEEALLDGDGCRRGRGCGGGRRAGLGCSARCRPRRRRPAPRCRWSPRWPAPPGRDRRAAPRAGSQRARRAAATPPWRRARCGRACRGARTCTCCRRRRAA